MWDMMRLLAEYPMGIQPNTNSALHQLEGLLLGLNHFSEKNGINFSYSADFRDICNSIKHLKIYNNKIYDLSFVVQYEFSEEKFRFIRNSVIATLQGGTIRLDVVALACEEVNRFCKENIFLLQDLNQIESIYNFFDWAFAYHDPRVAAETTDVQLQIVKKTEDGYLPFDPSEIKFVQLDFSLRGIDPRPHFPNEQ